MPLPALRCRLVASGSDVLSIEPWSGAPGTLAAKTPDIPTVFIVRADDLPAVREQKSAVIDRGRKHPAKALASRLLGQPRVPVVDGAFTSAGQLVRSVRTFLQLAAKKGECNAYVIGVSTRIFDDVAAKARTSGLTAALVRDGEHTPESRVSHAGSEETFPAADYLRLLDDEDVPETLTEKLVGESPEMKLVRQLIVLASRQQEPVLILGDTGTGKEIAARAIHDLDSTRRRLTFLPINCAAIPTELFESELFGFEKGVFSGALRRKVGLWSTVGGGTLFLDEIGELAPRHQAKILRVLEDGAVSPIGALTPVKVHCRVIAATNRDLYSMVLAGEFREDLYYRLRPVLIRTPRLRDHPQDTPVLARFFWDRVAPGRPPLSNTVLSALAQYRWPGNARELRAVLVSLATMFPNVAPRVEHVRAVFQLQSPTRVDMNEERLGAADDARLHRAECLRHLRRADEIIRACKVALQPFGAQRSNEAAAMRLHGVLAHRLAELHVLSLQPLLFHSIATFAVVNGLAGELASFQALLERDRTEAQKYLKKDLAREIKGTLSTIMSEVERLLKKL